MVKLKEVDSGHGTSLARTISVEDETAKAVLDAQASGQFPVCWEVAAKSAKVTDEPADESKPENA